MDRRFAPRSSNSLTPSADDAEVVELVTNGLDMVDRIARKLSRRLGAWLELEELLSAGREGLFDAARRFQHDRGAPFGAYASVRIRGAMLDSARRMAGLPRRTYERAVCVAPPATEAGEPKSCVRLRVSSPAGETGVEVAEDPESALERAQLLALIRAGISSLDAVEAELVRRHYFEEERLEDVATSLGITVSWASRILSRALARLTRQMRRRA